VRHDSYALVPAVVAALIHAAAWGTWLAVDTPALFALAVSLQVAFGGAMWFVVRPERRDIAVVLSVALPVVGPLASAWVDGVEGRGGTELLADREPPRYRMNGREIAKRLVESLPPCDAIVSYDVEARRATIARLAERANADDIAILRWARNLDSSEVAVEAAMALEEIEQRFEEQLRTAEDPRDVVIATSQAVATGVVDPALVGKLVKDARTSYEMVARPDIELVLARARLELAARQPRLALGVLKTMIATTTDARLVELHTEAAYAARRFDLLPHREVRRAAG
jgi:hypothetical protein